MQNNPQTEPPRAPPPGPDAWPGGLTKTQAQVAALLAVGATRDEVADALGFSGKTYDTHRRMVLQKVGARNAVHLARIALRLGLVSLDASADMTGQAGE